MSAPQYPRHKMYGSTVYRSWASMLQRCTNVKSPHYKEYGGRGIKVCEKWVLFSNFYSDMGDRPEGYTLNRIDNDGNYEPSNCEWATRKQQASNRRSSRLFTRNGVTKSLKQWSEIQDLNYKLVWQRIYRNNWSVEQALSIEQEG